MRKPSDKVIRSCLTGLRLVCMESNGLKEDGTAEVKIDCGPSAKVMLSRVDANRWIVDTPHNWLITVVVIIKDIHGNYDTIHDLVMARGIRIDDTGPDVQPMLDKAKGRVNQRLIVDFGWIAEILPTKRLKQNQDDNKFYDRAEQYLENWIINRHIEQEKAA